MWESPVSPMSLTAGVVLLVLGLIPILNSWGVTGFMLPVFLTGWMGTIAIYLIAAGGIFLLIDAWGEWGEEIGTVSLVVGLILIALGVVAVLSQSKILPFAFALPLMVYNYLFVVEAVLLIIGSWMQF